MLLLQMSLRRGTLSAFIAALGIWVSDVTLIAATHYGIGGLSPLLSTVYFQEIVGSIGSVILLVTAAFMWFRDPPDLSEEREIQSKRGLLSAFAQGFAINTFNPFTIGFWSLFTVTQVHDRELSDANAWAIYGGILLTIVISDSVKVLGARKLRDMLTPKVILRVQRLGALALGVFGVVLGVRVWLG